LTKLQLDSQKERGRITAQINKIINEIKDLPSEETRPPKSPPISPFKLFHDFSLPHHPSLPPNGNYMPKEPRKKFKAHSERRSTLHQKM